MSWFTDLLSSGVAKVVDSVGSVIDNIHTSEDEKLAAKQKLVEELNRFEIKQKELLAQYDAEITKRWQSDNEHVFTRLVRPLSYTFILALFAIIALFDGNIGQFSINPEYIPVINGLLTTMTIAYFGSRGIEKVTKTVKDK